MLAQYLDLAEQVNQDENNTVIIDISNYDYCLVQPIGADATFETTIDGGAVQGVTDGNAVSAANFTDANGLRSNETTSTTLINTAPSTQIIKFNVVGRYLKIICNAPVTKLLVMLAKIS